MHCGILGTCNARNETKRDIVYAVHFLFPILNPFACADPEKFSRRLFEFAGGGGGGIIMVIL